MRILEHTHLLKIGTLAYRFRFIVPDGVQQEAAFQVAKKQYVQSLTGHAYDFHRAVSATPSRNGSKIGDWIVHGIVSTSGQSEIRAASYSTTGSLRAVKHLVRRSPDDIHRVRTELGVLKKLQKAQRRLPAVFVVNLRETLYSTQPEWVVGAPDEVYILSQPLPRYTFAEITRGEKWPNVTPDIKKQLLRQTSLGLNLVHQQGCLHRDINPETLFVVSLDPPHTIVGGFDVARPAGMGLLTDVSASPVWSAPEFSNRSIAPFYSFPADVWSLGAVTWFLLESPLPWSHAVSNPIHCDPVKVRHQAYVDFMFRLDRGRDRNAMWDLVHSMMVQNPDERLTIQQVLTHRFFQG